MTIYIASKVKHAARWRQLRAAGAPIVASWLDAPEDPRACNFPALWASCINEARTARVLVLYVEADEVPKGAYVEMGAALGNGRPVLYAGPPTSLSAVEHPLVERFAAFDDAWPRALQLAAQEPEPVWEGKGPRRVRGATCICSHYPEVCPAHPYWFARGACEACGVAIGDPHARNCEPVDA